MVIAAGDSVAVGKCAAISLLAWCDLGDEILLIMERPESCMDLVEYLNTFHVTEALAMVTKLPIVLLGLFQLSLQLSRFSNSCFFLSGPHEAVGGSCNSNAHGWDFPPRSKTG